jgi:hypothetical protein
LFRVFALHVLGVGLCLAAFDTAGLSAQTAASDPSPSATTPAPPTSTAPEIDPSKLGVSLDRVRGALAQPPPSKTSGLRIQETIEVVGKAPKPLFWNPETAKLAHGPVPFGAPTQKDILNLITPQDFKTYPIDINALAQWLLAHLGQKPE